MWAEYYILFGILYYTFTRSSGSHVRLVLFRSQNVSVKIDKVNTLLSSFSVFAVSSSFSWCYSGIFVRNVPVSYILRIRRLNLFNNLLEM